MPRKLDGTFIESNTVSAVQLTQAVNDKAKQAYLEEMLRQTRPKERQDIPKQHYTS